MHWWKLKMTDKKAIEKAVKIALKSIGINVAKSKGFFKGEKYD